MTIVSNSTTDHAIIKEFCAENFTLVPYAIKAGAKRIELCDNLSQGGTTPSKGVIQKTLQFSRDNNVKVMVMIRPRGGDFTYNLDDAEIMLNDITTCQELGVDGVVFGATRQGFIDVGLMEQLIQKSNGMEVVYHMAFDQIEPSKQFLAVDWLAEQGVTRILTHGGPTNEPIEDHIAHLKRLISYAANRLTIMPGGGLSYKTLPNLLSQLPVQEVHGTKIIDLKLDNYF